jgi:hypothetical protein
MMSFFDVPHAGRRWLTNGTVSVMATGGTGREKDFNEHHRRRTALTLDETGLLKEAAA